MKLVLHMMKCGLKMMKIVQARLPAPMPSAVLLAPDNIYAYYKSHNLHLVLALNCVYIFTGAGTLTLCASAQVSIDLAPPAEHDNMSQKTLFLESRFFQQSLTK